MKHPKLIVSTVLFFVAICVAPIVHAAVLRAPLGWILYVNHGLGFRVAAPPNTLIIDKATVDAALGRSGGIQITKTEGTNPDLSVSVYANPQSLEKDFTVNGSTSFDDSMKKQNLKPTTIAVDGKKVTAYTGVHVVDGEGGKPYSSIIMEVTGSQHAYLLQFYHTSNVRSGTVKKYLASFHAE